MTRPLLFDRIEDVLVPRHTDPDVQAALRDQARSMCVLLDKHELKEVLAYLGERLEATSEEWVNWTDVALVYAFAAESTFGAERAHDDSCDAGCGPPYLFTEGGVTYAAILWS
jgi:hypothetical protein